MNIFTTDDYRRIQAWLKANAIKDSDFAISEDTVPDKDILVITKNMSTVPINYKIKIKDLLNSSLGKVVIDKIIAKAVTINNVLTVDAANVKLNNEKGTTLQDVLNYFENNKLNRHTDDIFDGNLTIKKDLTIGGHIKSDDGLTTVEENFEATGEITDGNGNQLSEVNSAARGWTIEAINPQQDEPTVRAKYVLKDYNGVPKGNTIKIYKDSAITNVYLGTTEDTCNPDTGKVTKKPIHDNNEALSIVYRLDTGKYMLVNVPLGVFTREAEFDKYRGLGIEPNGQVFIKLASDIESTNYLHFNTLGEISADGIEARILRDLGTLISSVADDGTMWGQYKQEEGTQETSTSSDGSRWGEFKKAESIRDKQVSDEVAKIQSKVEEVNLDTIKQAQDNAIQAIAAREAEILTKSDASEISASTVGLGGSNVQANLNDASNKLTELSRNVDKKADEKKVAELGSTLDKIELYTDKGATQSRLRFLDKHKNAIAILSNGHIKTKNFNSKDFVAISEAVNNINESVHTIEEDLSNEIGERTQADNVRPFTTSIYNGLSLSDNSNNTILRVDNYGDIKTKGFNSKKVINKLNYVTKTLESIIVDSEYRSIIDNLEQNNKTPEFTYTEIQSFDAIVNIQNQTDFDAISTTINNSIAALSDNGSLCVLIHSGVYYTNGSGINLSNINKSINIVVKGVGDVKIINASKDTIQPTLDSAKGCYTANFSINGFTTPAISDTIKCFTDNDIFSISDSVEVNGHIYHSPERVEVVNTETKYYRIKSEVTLDDKTHEECAGTYLGITSWYEIRRVEIDKIEGNYIYFYSTQSVDGDYSFARRNPRYWLINYNYCNKDFFYIKNNVLHTLNNTPIHIGSTSSFITINNTSVATLLILDISVLYGGFLNCSNTIFSNACVIKNCNFKNCINTISISSSNNIIIKNNYFEKDKYRSVNISSSENVYCGYNTFNECSIRSNNDRVVNVSNVQNYLITHNILKDFGYCGIGVGTWWGSTTKGLDSGIIEYNELYQTDSFIAHIEDNTIMDGGAIYIFSHNVKCIIRNNNIHDYNGVHAYRGIFCDDGGYNISIYNNIISNVNTISKSSHWSIDLRFLDGNADFNAKNPNHNTHNICINNLVNQPIKFEGRPNDGTTYSCMNYFIVGNKIVNTNVKNRNNTIHENDSFIIGRIDKGIVFMKQEDASKLLQQNGENYITNHIINIL